MLPVQSEVDKGVAGIDQVYDRICVLFVTRGENAHVELGAALGEALPDMGSQIDARLDKLLAVAATLDPDDVLRLLAKLIGEVGRVAVLSIQAMRQSFIQIEYQRLFLPSVHRRRQIHEIELGQRVVKHALRQLVKVH